MNARQERIHPRQQHRFPHLLHQQRGDEQIGSAWNYLDITAHGRQELWEDLAEGHQQTNPYEWWNCHDQHGDTTPSQRWVEKVEAVVLLARSRCGMPATPHRRIDTLLK